MVSNNKSSAAVRKEAISKAVAKEPPKSAPTKPNPKVPAKSPEDDPASFLSRLRPKRRSIFFLAFSTLCAGIITLQDPCDIKGKKRDCGYPGISPGQCRTGACFLKGGGSIGRKTVKVKRKGGASLGLVVLKGSKPEEGVLIESVEEGAVHEHNKALQDGSEDIIRPGDRILKLDKESSGIANAIGKTTEKTVELELRRNRVPSFLMWLENTKGKPSVIEKILTSPGSANFIESWSFLAKIGAACWLVSGYPISSLPTYMTISAAVSFYLTRCCHNQDVPSGEPHCYKGKRESISVVLVQTLDKVKVLFAKVTENPRTYFEWIFMP